MRCVLRMRHFSVLIAFVEDGRFVYIYYEVSFFELRIHTDTSYSIFLHRCSVDLIDIIRTIRSIVQTQSGSSGLRLFGRCCQNVGCCEQKLYEKCQRQIK